MPEVIVIDRDPRPYLSVNVLGFECDGPLDSGISCTILGKEGLDMVRHLNLSGNPSKVAIKTADGTLHVAICKLDIPYNVNGLVKVVPTLVIPSLSKHFILGIHFWNMFEIKPKFCSVSPLNCDLVESVSEFDGNRIELSKDQQKSLDEVIKEFLVTTKGKLGCTNILTHVIDTEDAKPVVKRPYPVFPFVQKDVDQELDRMLGLEVIEGAESEWANPIVIVKKPIGKIRMCLDARGLNDRTIKDRYPL